MNISAIADTAIAQSMRMPESDGPQKDAGFAGVLEKFVGQANDLIQQSEQKAVEIATGKNENLHEAMIAFEKAESAFKLLVQVRNKALEAYHEVLRMQI